MYFICAILHNGELCALHTSPSFRWSNQEDRWAGHVVVMWERRGAYRFLLGKPEGRRPLGRQRRRWEGNIRTDVREVG